MGSQDKFQPSPNAFIGRESELAELRAGFDEALAGHGRLFLISGEPGIGKTRITNELAAFASAAGAKVTWGRCREGHGTPAYWPWIEIVRTCVGDPASARLSALLDADRGEISELLPEVTQRRRSSPVAQLRRLPSPDPEEGRFRLFDSAARLLRNLAATQPLVILLDDLHDADQPSLLMLRFVARELGGTRILIIATYRDTEVRRSPALAKLIGELGREGKQLLLTGLSEAEVARFVAEHSRESPTPELTSMLHRATAGNPFFLDGIVRLLRARPVQPDLDGRRTLRDLRIPDGVREAIRRRLATFSEETSNILSIAAVVGQEFDADCLHRVSEEDADLLLDSLDEAQRDGIIIAANDTSARWRFSHGLIRETLYEDLPIRRRLKLHRRIAQVLEESYAGNPEPHLAELAYHCRKAARLGETAKAIDYSISAGEAALTVFAYEEAAEHWQAALELMPKRAEDRERRADLLERLGELLGMSASEGAEQVYYLEQALKLYQDLGRAQAAARVHSRLAAWEMGRTSADISRALEHSRKARHVLGEDSEGFSSVPLYVGMAATAIEQMQYDQALATSRRAMDLSQRLGDETHWASAANVHTPALCFSGRLAEAFALISRVWTRANQLDDSIGAFVTTTRACLGLISLLDPVEAAAGRSANLQTRGYPKLRSCKIYYLSSGVFRSFSTESSLKPAILQFKPKVGISIWTGSLPSTRAIGNGRNGSSRRL
jgi:eukaryotic-like serine/threonine-protein kinase